MKGRFPSALLGFTLLELLVALVVSMILIASIFTILTIVSRFVGDYRIQNTELNEAIVFSRTMDHDCFHARQFVSEPDGIVKLGGGETDVQYQFTTCKILRRCANREDSFDVKLLGYEVDSVRSKDDVIYLLTLRISIKNDTVPFIYMSKNYNRDLVDKTIAIGLW